MQTNKKALLTIYKKDSCNEFNTVIGNILKEQFELSELMCFEIDSKYLARLDECSISQLELLKSIGIEKQKSITTIINTKEDVLTYIEKRYETFIPYPFPLDDIEKSCNLHKWLLTIAKIYNQGWTPDWKNHSQYKYLPYRYWDKSTSRWVVAVYDWRSPAYSAGGLYFKSLELAEDALSKFRDLYDEYFNIK